jgi:hypothetical protein
MNPLKTPRVGEKPASVEAQLPEEAGGTDSATVAEHAGVEPHSAGKEAKSDSRGARQTLPPGDHPYDPIKKDLDPLAFALDRVQTHLIWILEHRATFEKLRHSDREVAESELSNLRDSTVQGMIYLQRLSELILAGYTIDSSKRLPESLRRGWFSSWVSRLSATEPGSQGGEQST